MISDGIGTIIGSILGSPFGTVVYVGHPVHKRVGARTGYSIMNGFIYLILCLVGVIPVILSVVPVIAIGPIIFIFGIMICEECTLHIAQRHHAAIFFGLFFGVQDYVFTQFVQGADRPSIIQANSGPYAMSKGSALSAMIWCGVIVYTVDRRWLRATFFCMLAALFSAIGLIHQEGSAFDEQFTEGTITESTSSFEFMIGYLSMAALCVIYYALQRFAGKKLEEGDEGFDDDHGYLQEINEPGVDDMFATWWEPAERALEMAMMDSDADDLEKPDAMVDASSEKGSSTEKVDSPGSPEVTA
eukprot:scaffold2811_cov102-Cylindrotheca_fusiformis.AAC.2